MLLMSIYCFAQVFKRCFLYEVYFFFTVSLTALEVTDPASFDTTQRNFQLFHFLAALKE